jgi:hypothetical protein
VRCQAMRVTGFDLKPLVLSSRLVDSGSFKRR